MKTYYHYIFAGIIFCSTVVSEVTAKQPGNLEEDSLQVTKIINAYITACGGEALAEIKSEFRKGTLVRGSTGQVPFEISYMAPGKWYYEQVFAWGDRIVYRSDGNDGWVQDTRQITDIKPEELLYLRLLLDVQAPLRIREFYPVMVLAGSEMIGDQHAVVLSVKSPEGLGMELSFDQVTGQLLRAGDMYFEDYRDVGKVKRPYRVVMGRGLDENHPRLIMQVTEISHDRDFDDTFFSEPSCLLALKESPIFRAWEEVEPDTAAMDECAGEYKFTEGYTIIFTREQTHLFFQITGGGIKYETRPVSDMDYFMRFNNLSFHFVRDSTGLVSHMELGQERTRQAVRIMPASD